MATKDRKRRGKWDTYKSQYNNDEGQSSGAAGGDKDGGAAGNINFLEVFRENCKLPIFSAFLVLGR